jgi:hypothetical protein
MQQTNKNLHNNNERCFFTPSILKNKEKKRESRLKLNIIKL